MKRSHFNAPLLFILVFFSTCVTAQLPVQELPLNAGKGIEYKSKTINTQIPEREEPPRQVPPGNSTKDRKVFWVHGHGGNNGSWDRAAAATQNAQVPPVTGYPARKITSHKMDYSTSHNAISAAGSDLKTQIETITALQPPTEKARNLIIAHSLGGMVSEYVDYLYDTESDDNRAFYGLVTVGTPNLGAVLANNSYPFDGSKAENFADVACHALSDGPAKELTQSKFLLSLVLNSQKVDKLIDNFCDILTNELTTLLLKGFNTQIAEDLKPNSQVVNLLSHHNPEVTRRISFYGILENEDMIWRSAHYMLNGPNAEQPFQAVNTQQTVDAMNTNRANCQAKVDLWDANADFAQGEITYCWFFCPHLLPIFYSELNNALDIRNAYRKGVDWYNSANDNWRLLMGDLELIPDPQGLCKCTTYNLITGESWDSGATVDCQDDDISYPIVTQCHWETTYYKQDVESDGIILASSAAALPGALKTLPFMGDSHFQMVNSPRLKSGLTDLWDGTLDIFFKTNPR
jgi:hypothetical protein